MAATPTMAGWDGLTDNDRPGSRLAAARLEKVVSTRAAPGRLVRPGTATGAFRDGGAGGPSADSACAVRGDAASQESAKREPGASVWWS
jgi:hypothetical protein